MTADVHTLTGAYAVDALPVGERAFFERHLGACEACNSEVEELARTAARLAEVTAEPSPATLRARVLALVDRTRQLAPATHRPAPSRPAAWRPAMTAVAAGVVLAALAMGAATPWRRDPPVSVEVAAVLAAGDLRQVDLTGPAGATVRFVYSQDLDRGVVIARGLPPAPDGHRYALWLYQDGQPRPAGVLVASAEVATTVVDGLVTHADTVAVTVEPDSATAGPTGTPIVQGALSTPG